MNDAPATDPAIADNLLQLAAASTAVAPAGTETVTEAVEGVAPVDGPLPADGRVSPDGALPLDAPVAEVPVDGWEGLVEQGLDLLAVGGPVVTILLIMSVFALAIILLKLWQFARLRLGARRFADRALEHWQYGRPQEALEALEGQRSPLAGVLATAIQGSSRHDVDRETLREEVLRQATAVLESLRSHLRGLEVIASLAPLLGLLGTVLGMIEAFRRLQEAGSQVDPSVLSGGIWEALLTTAVGLAVAIPAVAALNWLERRVERFGHRLEDTVTRVFTVGLRSMPHPAAVPLRRPGVHHAS